jgi:uncharacterized membrane protein
VSDRTLQIAVAVLALAGAAIAAYLTYARYVDATIACSTGGCETVQESEYAEILGLPVAVVGLGGYLAILATALFACERARVVGAAIALSGLVFSVYLVFVQILAIGAVCQWCLASDVVMALLATATVARLRGNQPAVGRGRARPSPASPTWPMSSRHRRSRPTPGGRWRLGRASRPARRRSGPDCGSRARRGSRK